MSKVQFVPISQRVTQFALLATFGGIFSSPASAQAAEAIVDTTPCLARASAGVTSTAIDHRASPSHSGRDTSARDTSTRATAVASAQSPVDVVIFAEASAREVRFATQPQLHVRLCGGLDSIHVIDRRNLPSPVVAGRTYRDVHVAVQIFGRLNADCLTSEWLGRRAALDSTGTPAGQQASCASLELKTAPPSRPPPDSTHTPRR